MKTMKRYPGTLASQKGVTTLLIGMFILLLMTIMTFFAVNVGLFEQRTSANEYRAKQAFKSSEAGLNNVVEYIRANDNLVSEQADGWFNAGSMRWTGVASATCDALTQDDDPFDPCAYMSPSLVTLGGTLYKYSNNAGADRNPTNDFLMPPTIMGLQGGGNFQVVALLCITADTDGDEKPDTCVTRAGNSTEKLAVQLISRGTSDDPLGGESITSIIVAPVRLLNAAVDTPIVVASTFAPAGNLTLVANPNGGGPGVPLSVWSNADVDMTTGTTQSCNLEEYFVGGTIIEERVGDNLTTEICLDCSCPADTESQLTSSDDGIDILDVDGNEGPIPDATNFPTDIFAYVFGLSTSKWTKVRKNFEEVDNCDGLNSSSSGLIWVNGSCNLNGTIGSAEKPILLVVAGLSGVDPPEGGPAVGNFRINAGGVFFGLIFVTTAPYIDEDASLEPNISTTGSPIVFGAIISDSNLDLGAGSIHIVYNAEVLQGLNNNNDSAWGAFPGTWADYLAN